MQISRIKAMRTLKLPYFKTYQITNNNDNNKQDRLIMTKPDCGMLSMSSANERKQMEESQNSPKRMGERAVDGQPIETVFWVEGNWGEAWKEKRIECPE